MRLTRELSEYFSKLLTHISITNFFMEFSMSESRQNP